MTKNNSAKTNTTKTSTTNKGANTMINTTMKKGNTNFFEFDRDYVDTLVKWAEYATKRAQITRTFTEKKKDINKKIKHKLAFLDEILNEGTTYVTKREFEKNRDNMQKMIDTLNNQLVELTEKYNEDISNLAKPFSVKTQSEKNLYRDYCKFIASFDATRFKYGLARFLLGDKTAAKIVPMLGARSASTNTKAEGTVFIKAMSENQFVEMLRATMVTLANKAACFNGDYDVKIISGIASPKKAA